MFYICSKGRGQTAFVEVQFTNGKQRTKKIFQHRSVAKPFTR